MSARKTRLTKETEGYFLHAMVVDTFQLISEEEYAKIVIWLAQREVYPMENDLKPRKTISKNPTLAPAGHVEFGLSHKLHKTDFETSFQGISPGRRHSFTTR